jgi:hypothetical protein
MLRAFVPHVRQISANSSLLIAPTLGGKQRHSLLALARKQHEPLPFRKANDSTFY